jgi:hypothetical protein
MKPHTKVSLAKTIGSISLPVFVLLEYFFSDTYFPLAFITIAGVVVGYLMYASDDEAEKGNYIQRLKWFALAIGSAILLLSLYFWFFK